MNETALKEINKEDLQNTLGIADSIITKNYLANLSNCEVINNFESESIDSLKEKLNSSDQKKNRHARKQRQASSALSGLPFLLPSFPLLKHPRPVTGAANRLSVQDPDPAGSGPSGSAKKHIKYVLSFALPVWDAVETYNAAAENSCWPVVQMLTHPSNSYPPTYNGINS